LTTIKRIKICKVFIKSPPPALEVTGDLDKEERRDGRSGYDLGAGLAGYDGGIDERTREEGFFASLSPPISNNKTEVTWAGSESESFRANIP
jgi:hypothetical protein